MYGHGKKFGPTTVSMLIHAQFSKYAHACSFLIKTLIHAHVDLIQYGHLWMVILVLTLMVAHFSMETHKGLFL